MPLKKRKVTGMYLVDMYCDKCGEPMEISPMVLSSYPPIYQYNCKKCGHTASSRGVHYPRIEYEYSDELEDVNDVV